MPVDPQAQTLRLFTTLSAFRAEWPRTLILSFGLSSQGAAFALAANIAGATCLSVDASAQACRDALRDGAVDFLVNTLDEALRTLKNEIRQGHPLSVALQAAPAAVLAEALDRGLLPDLFVAFATSADDPEKAIYLRAATAFDRLRVPVLDVDGTFPNLDAIDATALLEQFTAQHKLAIAAFQFSTVAMFRKFDLRALDAISPGDLRRRWAVSAARHFYRRSAESLQYERVLFLTPQERSLLQAPPADPLSL